MKWPDGFIAVDWGTTNRRAYRIDGSGECRDEFEDSKGVLTIAPGDFGAPVAEIRERLGAHPMLLAGMIGSNRGWKEAPYVPCPAGLDELSGKLVWPGATEAIVPGLSYAGDDRADVMRGEEVQLLGAVAAGLVDPNALVCHPGTHNKWAQLDGGAIQSFRTVMTGELFSLLKDHSILGDLLSGEVEANDTFRSAARFSLRNDALPAELFAIRARVLLGQAQKKDAASYASGLLIGTDVRIGLSQSSVEEVAVIGRPELTQLYAAAIAETGRSAIELDGERCFLSGIAEIAKRIS
jgi:2-dehydro-3-deoxygalactonokinase